MDVAVSGTSIWAAGAAGSATGTAVGTVVPDAGNIVGAVAGFVIGVGIYYYNYDGYNCFDSYCLCCFRRGGSSCFCYCRILALADK